MNREPIMKNIIPSFGLIILMILSSFAAIAHTSNVSATGNESVMFVETSFELHYDVGDAILFSAAISNADSQLNYEMEWRVCALWNDFGPDYSDWIDGDCVEYIGPDGNPVGGDIVVPAGVPDGYAVGATIPGVTSVDDGLGSAIDEDTLEVDQYVIAIMMSVSGVPIVTVNSTIFSVGDSANLLVDLGIEGDINEGQDYTFDWKATDLHQLGSVNYDLSWEVNDNTNTAQDGGIIGMGTTFDCLWSHYDWSCGREPSWHGWNDGPVVSGLTAGDYTLDIMIDRDGAAIGTGESEFSHSFSVLAPPLTGNEAVTVALTGANHYQLGDTVEFDWAVTGMNDNPSAITYDFEWRVCKLVNYAFDYSDDHSNWVDGACVEEIDTSSSPSLTNGGDAVLDNSGVDDSGTITSNPITLPRCGSWNYGCEYVVAGMVLVNGVVITSANSTIFSLDSVSSINVHVDRSGDIPVGQDLSFSWHASNMHEKGSVAYDVQWEILDTSTSPASSTAFQGTEAVPHMSWRGDDYEHDWRTVSHPSYAEDVSGLVAGDYQLRVWLQMDGVDDYSNAEDTHDFTVIGDTLTGNEAVQISGVQSNYDLGEDIEIEVDVTGLVPQPSDTNYDLTWKVCKLTPGDYNGAYWDNYHINYLANEYWDLTDWVDRECGNTAWPFYMPEAAIDGDSDMYITSGTHAYTLDGATAGLGPGEYVIAAILEVKNAIVASVNSDYFSVDSAAEVYANLERSGNILADMDYNFEFGASDAFFMSDVEYDVFWVVRNDLTGISAGFGSYAFDGVWDTGGQSASVPSSMLSFGDYTLYVWLERDGVADSSPEADLEHSFRVINPALNTLATISVQVDTTANGWGQGTVVAYDLDNGQLFTMGWSVTDMMNNVVDSGEDTWIAPPDTKNWILDFDHITNGNYCLGVNLYAAQILVHIQNDCWTQATTEDADSDGVLDPDDMCPFIAAVIDVNGDGCEDVDDTDGDGMDDDWESYWGTDVYVDDSADDSDGDGLTNLQEFDAGTNPLHADSDGDGVNDGSDVCPMAWGDGVDGCLVPINMPPVCNIYYSLESAGMIVTGDVAILAIPPTIPGGMPPQQIIVPPGSYYIIAVCADPDGDPVTATVNGITVGPASEATVGAVVLLDDSISNSVDVTLGWTDGTNNLAATITVVVDNSGNYSPGFTSVLGLMALLGAALMLQRRRL